MSKWLDNAVLRAENVDDWLSPQRRSSLQSLKGAKWPSRKTEAWKYTPLFALADADFDAGKSVEQVVDVEIEGLVSIDLIFVNGVLQSTPEDLPFGLSVYSFDQASVEQKLWASKQFSGIKPERHLFGLVNDVLATAGIIVDVADNTVVNTPIRIVNVVTDNNEAHSRLLVRLGKSSKAVVIEQNVGNGYCFNTAFSEYDIAEQAELEHYRFMLQTDKAMSVAGCHFNLGEKTQLNSTLVGFGSTLSRLDVDVTHAGEHAFAKMNAIYLLDGEELFDLHTCIEHAVPHGTTEENVRGIVADRSRAVFNGRIHIHRDAQKTLAELNNRNLLMSRQAEINTKPELEIYADDVRCAHGATIAEIDKKALYYLQSRGVHKAQAQVMLNFGFINELVDQMPNQVLAEWLRPQLRQRFADMDVK